MAGGGQILPPLCNFCLDGPIELKFGMWMVYLVKFLDIRKKLTEFAWTLLKTLLSAFFTRNAIKSVPNVIFQFCFHLQQANRL